MRIQTGFYTEFRCGLREQSGLAWGAILKVTTYKAMHTSQNGHIPTFPKQCSHCRGSGGDSGTGRLVCKRFPRLRRPTFVRRHRTSCMSPRSRAKWSVAPLSSEKTLWFQHIFLSAQIVLLVASGMSLVAPECPWMSLQGCLEVPPEPFWVPGNPYP